MQAPCKDCPERHYLCHASCEKYIAFQKYREEYLARQRETNQLKTGLWESCRHSKAKKKKGRFYADNRGGC